jgi:hypothetical protein
LRLRARGFFFPVEVGSYIVRRCTPSGFIAYGVDASRTGAGANLKFVLTYFDDCIEDLICTATPIEAFYVLVTAVALIGVYKADSFKFRFLLLPTFVFTSAMLLYCFPGLDDLDIVYGRDVSLPFFSALWFPSFFRMSTSVDPTVLL